MVIPSVPPRRDPSDHPKKNKTPNYSSLAQKTVCIFCNTTGDRFTFLYQGTHFFVTPDAAPLTKGHLLLVSTTHLPCFAAMEKAQEHEYIKIKNRITRFLKEQFGNFIVFEHGVLGQTVSHAHQHFVPITQSLTEFVKKQGKLEKIKSFKELQAFYRKNKGYLFFEEAENMYALFLGKKVPAGYFHTFLFPKKFGVSSNAKERIKKSKKEVKEVIDLW